MYKYWNNGRMWASVDLGWHFGLGWEVTSYPIFRVTLPFLRLSLGWES